MTKLAQLIAREEGFFKSGTLPARSHNPGDLRHSPHSQHPRDANAIGVIDTDAHGWEDLERQLTIDASRAVTHDPVSGASVVPHLMTLRDAVYSWAPPSENNTAHYLADIVNGFGGIFDEFTPLSHVLLVPA